MGKTLTTLALGLGLPILVGLGGCSGQRMESVDLNTHNYFEARINTDGISKVVVRDLTTNDFYDITKDSKMKSANIMQGGQFGDIRTLELGEGKSIISYQPGHKVPKGHEYQVEVTNKRGKIIYSDKGIVK